MCSVVVVYVTLFPFDFVDNGKSLIDAARDFNLILSQPWVLNDAPRNVALFVPFGFALSGLVGSRLRTWWSMAVVVTASGLLLSASVELIQASTLLRFPSLADILANGAGTAFGCGLFRYAGQRILETAATFRRRVSRGLTRRRRMLVALTPMLGILLVTLGLGNSTELGNWDESFPLVIGNERTGDRAWSGSIASVYLADRAFSSDEAAQVLRGAAPAAIDTDAAVLDYDFTDVRDTPAGLVRRGSGRETYTARGVLLGPTRWLESAEPVTEISRALAAAGHFTLSIEATTSDPDQDGPARLVSISDGAFDRNLTIGRDGPDLVVRVRSRFTGSNGRSPEFIVPGVFSDVETHRLVLIYNGSAIRLTVDDAANAYEIELLPSVAFLMTFFPDDVGQMRFTDSSLVILRVIYRALMFLPWAAWFAADRRSWASTASRASRASWPLLVLLPAPFAEVVHSNTIPSYELEPGLVLMGWSITVLGYVVVRLRHGGTTRSTKARPGRTQASAA